MGAVTVTEGICLTRMGAVFVNGVIKINDGGYMGIVDNTATPVPTGGAGTLVFYNNHFFGWTGTAWKQLDQ